MVDIKTKDDLLNKLRAYADTPDNDIVLYKNLIYKALLNCPELLYSIHEKDLESELFDENGYLLVDDNGELLGEVDRYFGDNGNIRPYLYIPQTQDKVKNYVCYQVSFDEMTRFNNIEKYCLITFTILVNGKDRTDNLTGIPRHDLIASIISERINWSNLFGNQCKLISNKESITDNDFLVRTLVFQTTNLNGILTTVNGKTKVTNNIVRR